MLQLQTAITFGIITILISSCNSSKSISTSNLQLNHFKFEELDSVVKQRPKPTMVFLHAEWCQFCRNMEQTTFKNQEVIQNLNDNYYFISFDGEYKEPITFRGRTFQYQPSGRNSGLHELARELGTINNSMSYPTIVIINADYEIVFQEGSFLNAKEVNRILKSHSN